MFLPPVNFKIAYPIDIGAVINRAVAQRHGGEAAKQVAAGCMALQALRTEVLGISSAGMSGASEASRDVVLKYLKALDCVAPHIDHSVPLSENLVWTDSLDADQLMQQPYLVFERSAVVCILANLEAALGYQAGMKESFENACGHFQRAAGYYDLLTSAPPSPSSTVTVDLTHESLKCMQEAMLANAQMSFYRVASSRGMPAETTCKLAAAASTLLKTTKNMAASPTLDKTGLKSRIGGPCEILEMYFEAEANDCRAAACEEEHEMREPLARIYLAQTIVFNMQKAAPTVLENCEVELRQLIIDKSSSMAKILKQRMETAVKHNEQIYKVKPMPNPPPLEEKILVKPTSVQEYLKVEIPMDVQTPFSTLANKKASGASKQYMAQTERFLESNFGPLQASAASLKLLLQEIETVSHALAQSGAQVEEQKGRYTENENVQRAVHAGGLAALDGMANEVKSQAEKATMELSKIESQLTAEAEEDRRLRSDPRVASGRPPSHAVTGSYTTAVAKIREELGTAAKSDAYVRRLLQSSRANLQQLPASASQADPVLATSPGHLRDVLLKVKPSIAEAQGAISEKDALLAKFNESRQSDVLEVDQVPPGDPTAYFADRLQQAYGSTVDEGRKLQGRITALEQSLQDGLVTLKKSGDRGSRASAEDVTSAASKWAELQRFFNDGITFYRKEEVIITQLGHDVNQFCAARSAELDGILGRAMGNISLGAQEPRSGGYNPFRR